MHRSAQPSPSLPTQISVREHDYSIRLIKIGGFPEKSSKTSKKATRYQPGINPIDEITELFIEPLVTNVVKVLDVTFCTNIPLEEIRHSDGALEITPIGDLNYQEEMCSVLYLSETCKVCLKDLSNSPACKIPFFVDFGQISPEIANISTELLESMNVEITDDEKLPRQMCIECYNVFTKMSLFKQTCKRSSKALATICEFTAKQQSNRIKVERDVVLYGLSPEIKEEPVELLEPEDDHQMFDQNENQNPLTIDPTDVSNDHEPDKSFICIRCGRNFGDQFNLVQHKRYDFCVDEDCPECRVCHEKLPSLTALDHHLENSHSCFPCTKCAKSFNTLPKFNKHQRYHLTLICDFCSQSCFSKRSMRQHLMSHVIGLYPCQFCDQRFATRKRVGIHKRNVHPNELYQCAHCPKSFKIKDTYRVHIMKHNPDKRHKCTYCTSQFVHRHHLENHIRTHTKETPFLCNFCGKAFRGEVALRAHLSIHDPKLYPHRYRFPKKPTIKHCSLCDYSSVHGNLKKHMMNVHGRGVGHREHRKFEYSCHMCDKEFRQSTSLMNHLRIHNEVRDYHCTYCKASFRKAHYLRLHVDGVHLNKRPNKCDQCDAAYLISNDLRRHKLQKHSTERPFQCYYCQKTFKMATSLKVHINRMHEMEMEK